jgi:hypothetical protein
MTQVLAFDIGIKNLAWCCLEKKGDKMYVKGWSNENLITGGTAEEDKVNSQCQLCSHKASFQTPAPNGGAGIKAYCVRHCPPLTPALRDLSGNLIKKIPSATLLRQIAQNNKTNPPVKGTLKTKESTLNYLKQFYALPITQAVKVKKMELEELHNGIQDVVVKNADLFSECDEILLENQPVFKNPVMKSVQMMLYATLRDLVEGPPKLRLVHAKQKTLGATSGDEGYSERKGMSETKVEKGLKDKTILMDCSDGRDSVWFSKQSKKSDLADCLCMCLDSFARNQNA